MTAGLLAVPVGPAPGIPAPAAYGVISCDLAGLGTVRGLVGGDGQAKWKQVINGMHLPGGWGCVEYVQLPPGSSCGRHLHATREEIYVILDGAAVMTINGDETPVNAGDLITAPLGTIHGIGVPPDAGQAMSMLVVEALPGSGRPPGQPVRIPLRGRLGWCQGWRGGSGLDETRVAVADLGPLLTGGLRRCTLIEIAPMDELGEYQLPPGTAEVLFVASGEAEITAGDAKVTGHAGLTVGTSLEARVKIRNLSTCGPLTVISTEAAA